MTLIIRLAWPIVLGILIFITFGPLGFNPTDEGFVNGVAYRVLNGQIPHRDFIWARPVGSAYLHAPELLLPTPGLMTSRAIALGEIVAYTLLLSGLTLRRGPRQWGVAEIGIVITAILLNLNTMPLMVWPTIDGILLVAGGAVLLQRGLARGHMTTIGLAFLLLGAATMMKQSFWPAPFFGFVWLVAASSAGTRLRNLGLAVGGSTLVPLLYVGIVAVAGGMDEMLIQLGSATPVFGIELFTLVSDLRLTVALVVLVGLVTVVAALPRTTAGLGPTYPALLAAAVAGIVGTIGLDLVGEWAIVLWWLALTATAVRSLRDAHVDWPGLVLIGLGWMVTLSYGLESPALVAGSLAGYVVLRALPEAGTNRERAPMAHFGALVAAAILLVVCLPTFVSERRTEIYRDRPAAELTVSLDEVDDDFAGVITNPVTASYLEQLANCLHRFPADEVAVLPDNPAIYPYFELRNPFPADWLIPLDIIGSEDRFVEAAAELDARGGYLVLFQPIEARLLAGLDQLAPVPEGPFRDPELGAAMRAQLTGQAVACGSFNGVWMP